MIFEEGIKELENIILKLESGETKFDEATSLFERGAEICKQLNSSLDCAKGKITIIKQELEGLIEEEMK